jgi:hypothetical protein
MYCFHTKGELLFVFIQDGEHIITFDPYKERARKATMPFADIRAIDRWSAFTYVQYENFIEFFQMDKREVIEPISKIMLN